MLAQNGARLAVVLGQTKRWNYAEFQIECEKAGQAALPIGEWAQKVGMLTAAMFRWPDVEPAQAYQNMVHEMNSMAAQAIQQQRSLQNQQATMNRSPQSVNSEKEDCPGCGGGIVK